MEGWGTGNELPVEMVELQCLKDIWRWIGIVLRDLGQTHTDWTNAGKQLIGMDELGQAAYFHVVFGCSYLVHL